MTQDLDKLLGLLDEPAETTAASDTQIGLLKALDQLFNTISFYPPGHAQCQDVARKFYTAARPIVGADTHLRMSYRQPDLCLQGRELGEVGKEAGRLIELLDVLGVSSLELAMTASVEDLQALVRELLAAKHKAETSLGFSELTFAHLPDTVKIEQREFGRRGFDGSSGGLAGKLSAVVDEIVVELSEPGQDEATLSRYRDMADKLLGSLTEQIENNGSLHEKTGNRSLADVLDLGAHAIKQILPTLVNTSDEATLQLALEQVGQSMQLDDDQDYIQEVLDVLRRTVQQDKNAADAAAGQARVDYQWPLPDLLARIKDLQDKNLEHLNLGIDTQHEHMAVYLHVLNSSTEAMVISSTATRLANALGGHLSRASSTLLVTEVGRLLHSGNRQLADMVLPKIMAPLRKSGGFGLSELWQRVSEGLDDEGVAVAWPHLVCELIRDRSESNPQDLGPVIRLITQLDYRQALAEVSRIESSAVFVTGKFDQRLFKFPKPEFYSLLAALLTTSKAGLFGKWLHAGLSKCPPTPQAAAVVRAMVGYSNHHQNLVQQILLAGRQPWPGDLRGTAAQVICGSLDMLAPVQRKETWVSSSLAALGDLGVASARPLLQKIMTERRLLFFWVWPEACRKAAAKSLQKLDRTSEPE